MTDKPLFDMGFASKVTNVLDTINIDHQASVCEGGRGCVCGRKWGKGPREVNGERQFSPHHPSPAPYDPYPLPPSLHPSLSLPQIFYHVTPDPTMACIEAGLKELLEFKPDIIIALGGGSPMDAAKVM